MNRHFTKEQQHDLLHMKYGKWAAGLSTDDLFHVLCLIGEYGVRSQVVLPLLERHASEVGDLTMFARAFGALVQLNDAFYGRRKSHGEIDRIMVKILNSRLPNPPESDSNGKDADPDTSTNGGA